MTHNINPYGQNAVMPSGYPIADNLTWEIDEFHGRLEGRVIAELELQHEYQAFIKPDFIGEEVTGMPQYYNANM